MAEDQALRDLVADRKKNKFVKEEPLFKSYVGVIIYNSEKEAFNKRVLPKRKRYIRPIASNIFKPTMVTSENSEAYDLDADPWRHHYTRDSKPKRRRSTRSANNRTPNDKLGGYTLGHTLGEGEFGKVRIGWKTADTSNQAPDAKEKTVAVKVISRSKLNTQGRLAKVYREIAILKALDHPNIVHLYEMVDTESTFGLVLEYASGGELFDYILRNRYLEDRSARRLFAQLVSGVGYLHRNGIIHRDLKLENLLLDHNQNIIITDFGFANSFDPEEKLPADTEHHLHDRDFIEKHGLDRIRPDGLRRGDLMSTSCGSPCYAAPELVVSDGLYSGKKVDVWSCGVILYAMLAGYLPFDDDPANPEGDNINLLYKYICTTPLIFPDYVSPHSRDILRRILVPDPIKRADLFEVARHSWVGEFSRTVEAITSGVPLPNERRKIPHFPRLDEGPDPEMFSALARSSSLKESSKSNQGSSPLGGPTPKHAHSRIDQAAEASKDSQTSRDTKRRTVQVEYVPPHTQTARGDPNAFSSTKSNSIDDPRRMSDVRPAPPEKDYPPAKHVDPRLGRHATRGTSESTAFKSGQFGHTSRPSTGASATGGLRLPPSRGSYGQPSAAAVAPTSAQGRFSRPQSTIRPVQPPSHYSDGERAEDSMERDRMSADEVPAKSPRRGHKRASTLGGIGEKILDRASSVRHAGVRRNKHDRAHPPTSMRPVDVDSSARKSNDSRRSLGFSRKSSDLQSRDKRSSRRFSFLPRPKVDQPHQYSGPPHTSHDTVMAQTTVTPWSDGPASTQGTAGAVPEEKWSHLPNKNRRFNEAYDRKEGAGSSGAARRVMEFFRRRK